MQGMAALEGSQLALDHEHNWYVYSYLVLACDKCDALKRDEGELNGD
jgi:hypothetical protein